MTAADVVLISCVKSKQNKPAKAKDLYISDLFAKERAYAERSGRPWFILSAEHGLVDPEQVLAPYEAYLPAMPASYRRSWGNTVITQLETVLGSLRGLTLEIHAGRPYVRSIQDGLLQRGANVLLPLDGLRFGTRLRWYNEVGR
jgi:hypothetical protein